MKFTNILIILLSIFFIGFSQVALAEKDHVPGKPFADLQEQIDNIQSTNGTQVGPGLYHVHTRVLWDLGWLAADSPSISGGFFTYWEEPKSLVYGPGTDLFLSPLEGYGIPEIPIGADRKVRLYVNYGHQWMCGGTPTVRIGGANGVEFSLPKISGHYGAMGANWSDFKDSGEYEGIGHAQIQVYQKDFYYEGPQCGPWPGTGPGRPKGTVYRIEAHFYDQY